MISLLPKQHIFLEGILSRKIKEENKEFFIKGVQRFYAAVFFWRVSWKTNDSNCDFYGCEFKETQN